MPNNFWKEGLLRHPRAHPLPAVGHDRQPAQAAAGATPGSAQNNGVIGSFLALGLRFPIMKQEGYL